MSQWNSLQSDLDDLAGKAKRSLRGKSVIYRFRKGLFPMVLTGVLVAATFMMLAALGRLFEIQSLQLKLSTWIAFAVLVFVVNMGRRLLKAWNHQISRKRALAEWDDQLHLADRLNTADEFLKQTSRGGFHEAAIADAAGFVSQTQQAKLDMSGPLPSRRSSVALFTVAIGMFALGWWASLWQVVEAPVANNVEVEANPFHTTSPPVLVDQPDHEADTPAPWKGKKSSPPPGSKEAVSKSHSSAPAEQEEAKETPGSTQSGRSAAAVSSSGTGSAQGTPTKQGQISKQSEQKTAAKPKKAAKKKPPQKKAPSKPQDEEQSGATSGRGSSKGSNRNPAASDWSSKDHVNTPDDEDLDNETDIEEDEEEQEARGGMQPSLRDRRPPVSRDLSIGFGNRPSPDANGRGGPSQPKKSRGTASLVLGVPIPDRIKGQPNPGRTKITQERVQPKAEAMEIAQASTRHARSQTTSSLGRQDLQPWMRNLVRDFFLHLRQSK